MGLIEVRSAINRDTNSPVYGNCTLSIGDGTIRVPFENGRSMVEEDIVRRYLINNGGLEFPSLGIWRTPEGTVGAPAAQDAASDLQGGLETQAEGGPIPVDVDDVVAQLPAEEKAGLVGKLLGQLGVSDAVASQVVDQIKGDDVPNPETADERPNETEDERRLRESAEEVERLKAAGELPDDPEADASPSAAATDDGSTSTGDNSVRVVPSGFDDKTQEGELRCLAKTASGSQCKNAAVTADGVASACAIEAHQKQFSS